MSELDEDLAAEMERLVTRSRSARTRRRVAIEHGLDTTQLDRDSLEINRQAYDFYREHRELLIDLEPGNPDAALETDAAIGTFAQDILDIENSEAATHGE